ncbi:MAG TPA: dihydrolipoamide acetyltransferase family protein [Ktedonosporobacter sp.]|nr:dihydrolipoamide acetyltransferase family protein [Ktedonosporobacter sp.]
MPEVNMPRLSDTMQEGTITRWLKKPGDTIKKGDIIAEVETDKANMEVEAYDAGTLEQILVNEGDTAPIGQVIAIIGSGAGTQKQPAAPQAAAKNTPTTANGTAKEVATTSQAPSANNQVAATSSRSTEASRPVASTQVQETARPAQREEALSGDGKLRASPLARRMAEEHGVNLHQLQGTGPGGRIVRDDIEDYLDLQRTAPATTAQPESAAASVPSAEVVAPEVQLADVEVISLSSMQKTIARRLTESKQQVPHFYIGNEIDMTDALALRQTLNASTGENGVKVSVNDLIVKACALALEKFPEVNSSWKDSQFVRHKRINIGIAIDIPGGLIVPVLKDANIKGVRSLAREAKALAEKARSGKLTADDLQGGTFSISNLGMMDVTDFIAVINPPEAAIMAVASARKTFVPINDQPVIRDLMHVTISADHRILYGATVARFLHEVKGLLEQPYSLLG